MSGSDEHWTICTTCWIVVSANGERLRGPAAIGPWTTCTHVASVVRVARERGGWDVKAPLMVADDLAGELEDAEAERDRLAARVAELETGLRDLRRHAMCAVAAGLTGAREAVARVDASLLSGGVSGDRSDNKEKGTR